MQARHAILVIVVLVIGVLAKQFFWPAKNAEANVDPSAGLNPLQMQQGKKDIPAQDIDDRTFVFGPN
jgi:hypothetical protein